MGRKLEWELSGKSDVPEKMAKAKASMEGLDGAANALSKKFKEAFKDIAVGFVAPMVLVQKAIGFITDQFQKLQQFAQESRDFAKDAENSGKVALGAREAILQADERARRGEEQRKRVFGEYQGYRDFLINDPRGRKMVEQEMPVKTPATTSLIELFLGRSAATAFKIADPTAAATATGMATRPDVQAKIEGMLAKEAADRAAKAAEEAAKVGGPTAQKIAEVSGNVIGVGQSPQLDAMRQQIVLQEDMANSLRQLVEADQAKQGFRPERGFDLGGMGSSGRTVFPR